MRDLQEKLGLTYLLITHNLAVVRFMATRVGVMYLGRLVEIADAEALFVAAAPSLYAHAARRGARSRHERARRARRSAASRPTRSRRRRAARFIRAARRAIERCRRERPAFVRRRRVPSRARGSELAGGADVLGRTRSSCRDSKSPTPKRLLSRTGGLGPDRDADDRARARQCADGHRGLASSAEAGAAVARIPGRDGYGDNLIARVNPRAGEKPILVAGHLDTVWSAGTLASMPFRVEGERAHGPGIFDMKAGSFAAFYAVRAIARQRLATEAADHAVADADEEVGSPTSRAIIEREAADAALALIPEPAGPDGVCVTARKGVGRFTLHVDGVGSHAGRALSRTAPRRWSNSRSRSWSSGTGRPAAAASR